MPATVSLPLALIVLTSILVGTVGAGHTPVAHAQPAPRSTSAILPSLGNARLQDREPAFGVYRPVFPNDLTAVDEYEGTSGVRMDIVHWYALWGGWKSAFDRSDLESVGRRGSIPLITWEPWSGRSDDPGWSLRQAVLSGRHDAYIASWARGLADYQRPVLLRFGHEMHHQSYPWAVGINGNTADDYVATWRHVHDIFARHGATNVEWVWNPNTLAGASAEIYEPLYRSLYPGDEYVDWVGLDIYNTGPELDWGAPTWRSFAEILGPAYHAVAMVTDKPLLLPEVGCAESGGSKATWIDDALRVQLPTHFPRVRGLVWFDTDKEERWALHSSDRALGAWTAAVASLLRGR